MKHILFCSECKKYSMKEECPNCKNRTVLAKPPKYSSKDKYDGYRRKAKEQELKEKGLL
ncbi:ribosome biogenesis protein [archaeon]|jgi:H/ACA ribonucleoprotein complex subunit 3|nr:ribosome biogenesis protein [archaeon]MBT3451447.1 ribosome biogenesis protein [archaeon]MBT6868971.1 ribosome biogenesis protein [archaeon]MBT7193237.1 ribosome biogenesis protein [archaeon]MBT7380092.1 ribosome biogenesis protein [archaeon]